MKSQQEQLLRKLNERFVRAFATYRLLEDGDHVLIGLSGGKDSLLLTELLALRSRIRHPEFKVEAAHVRMQNIRYETSTDYLEQFCHDQSVPLHILTTRFEVGTDAQEGHTQQQTLRKQKQPCFLCSWYRRKELFNLAQELDCNKIALGHHRDDIIHTTLMNLTFQGRFDTMPPLLRMRKMPLTIIRPLCLIDEAEIRRYAELCGYEKVVKTCPYEHDTNRTAIADLYDSMERLNPEARFSIWKALETEGKLATSQT